MKSTSGCKLLVHLWLDHPGQVRSIFLGLLLYFSFFQPTTSPKEEGKKKKKGGGKTVSSVYLVSLGELMTTLVRKRFRSTRGVCQNCVSAQLRAPLCPLPGAQHPQEARRGGAPTHHAPADLQRRARGNQDLYARIPQQVISSNGNLEGQLNQYAFFRMLYPDFKMRYAVLGQARLVLFLSLYHIHFKPEFQ